MGLLATVRHERFAQEIAKGKASALAYELAGFSARGHSAEVLASRLLQRPEVAARIAELQERASIRCELSRADILNMIVEDRDLAREGGQAAAALKADELLGKELFRMFTDRKEILVGDMAPDLETMRQQMCEDWVETGAVDSLADAYARFDRRHGIADEMLETLPASETLN